MPDLIDHLKEQLTRAAKPSSDFDLNPEISLPEGRELRAAAVLVALFEQGGEWRVILTMRSSVLKHHPGQIAFPGGKKDEGDASLIDTALREAEEEIGLRASNVTILGQLPEHETVTGFRVTPIVGVLAEPFQLVPEVGEVAEVFSVPFDFLKNEDNFQIQSRRWRGKRRYYFVVPFGPYYIWGATARMLRALAHAMGAQ